MSNQGSAPKTTASGSHRGDIDIMAGIEGAHAADRPVQSIGVPTPLIDGPEKVSGKAATRGASSFSRTARYSRDCSRRTRGFMYSFSLGFSIVYKYRLTDI
ncbi:MAG: hypothetical protein ABFS30_16565 [Pseudomonadota bacterium]